MDDKKNENNFYKLKETTVTEIEGVRVGCGNFMKDEYLLPNGDTTTGNTAQLSILGEDKDITVGMGSQLPIGQSLYEVKDIRPASWLRKFGYLTLSKIRDL